MQVLQRNSAKAEIFLKEIHDRELNSVSKTRPAFLEKTI